MLARELVSASVVDGVQLATLERLHPWIVRPERVRPGAGGIDDCPCPPGAFVRDDIESVVVTSADAVDMHGSVHGQCQPLFVVSVVISNDLGRRSVGIDLTERPSGQRMDAMRGAELQRRPPVLPRTASFRIRVEYDVAGLGCQAGVVEEVSGRQASLACPDYDNVDVHGWFNAAVPGPIPRVESGRGTAVVHTCRPYPPVRLSSGIATSDRTRSTA
jgi:hypothetical protein